MLQTKHLDLCSICANHTHCVFTRNMNHSVVYCEEFLHEIPGAGQLVQTNVANEFPNKLSNDATPLNAEINASLQGLCADCENRRACGLAMNPEGGVWYCEEYR